MQKNYNACSTFEVTLYPHAAARWNRGWRSGNEAKYWHCAWIIASFPGSFDSDVIPPFLLLSPCTISHRVLRELRERYLHAGAPLELPAEARSKLHVSKSSRLTLQQLGELQQALVQGLRDYW